MSWKSGKPNPLAVPESWDSFAVNICLFACLVCPLIPDGFTLCMGKWDNPLTLSGGSLF